MIEKEEGKREKREGGQEEEEENEVVPLFGVSTSSTISSEILAQICQVPTKAQTLKAFMCTHAMGMSAKTPFMHRIVSLLSETTLGFKLNLIYMLSCFLDSILLPYYLEVGTDAIHMIWGVTSTIRQLKVLIQDRIFEGSAPPVLQSKKQRLPLFPTLTHNSGCCCQ